MTHTDNTVIAWNIALDHILYHLQMSPAESKRLTSTLSLVCRYFRARYQPRLFFNIELCEDSRFTTALHVKQTRRWARLLKNKDEEACAFAPLVEECRLDLNQADKSTLERVYAPALATFTNLGKFRAGRGTMVCWSLLRTLGSLPKLQTVAFKGCAVDSERPPWFESIGRHSWTDLEVHGCSLRALIPFIPAFQQLVDSRRIHRLITDDHCLAFALFEDGRYELALRTFQLASAPDPADFHRFLERCTHLESLKWTSHNTWAQRFIEYRPTIPASTVPRLTTIACHPLILPMFLSARPISSIGVNMREEYETVDDIRAAGDLVLCLPVKPLVPLKRLTVSLTCFRRLCLKPRSIVNIPRITIRMMESDMPTRMYILVRHSQYLSK